MPTAIHVLLIEDNRLEARQTLHWLGVANDGEFEIEAVDRFQLGSDSLARGGIDMVLLDLNLPDSRGMETFFRLHEQFPLVPIVVLTGEYDDGIGPSAVEQGAQDFLVKQQADAPTLKRVIRHAVARQRAIVERGDQPQRGKSDRVIGFIGAKGGSGTTTTALNVALALAQRGKSVILVELRPSFGTLSCHWNWHPQNNLRRLLDLPADRIGTQELDAALTHSQFGLRILFGPQQPKEFKEIDPEQATAVVKFLSQMAEFVILDLPNQPSGATAAVVPLCNFVAVVTEREPAAVASGKATVNLLQSWGLGGNLVGAIVLNRTEFSIPMEFAEIESTMSCPIVGMVPWAANACLEALREGTPLVASPLDNDPALCLVEIAGKIARK
jgi:MinD-like ATPase involved in chromosome partitioning or flagellar assembly/CheY-like chemotaxis protein